MTLGEYRVGIDFNPSGDDTVGRVKRAAADLIDLVDSVPDALPEQSMGSKAANERRRLKALAMTHIEDAAMWAVKAATKREPNSEPKG